MQSSARHLALATLLLLPGTTLLAQGLMLDLDDEPAPVRSSTGAAAKAEPQGIADGLKTIKAPLSGCVVMPFGGLPLLPTEAIPFPTTNALGLVAVRSEVANASFVLQSRLKVDKLLVKASDLVAADGATIPAAAIDLRVVKCWYQSGNAWYTTAGDPDNPTLVPELLLHDDSLVTALPGNKQNSVRIDGQLTPVAAKASAPFLPDDDAATLQPLTLQPGQNRQLWLALRVPADATAGIYQGRIEFVADGKAAGHIVCEARVLPFDLPPPATYHDRSRPFRALIAHDLELASSETATATSERLQAAFADMADHLVEYPLLPQVTDAAAARRVMALRQAAGLPDRPLWFAPPQARSAWHDLTLEDVAGFSFDSALTQAKAAAELAGHHDLFCYLPTPKAPPATLVPLLEKFKAATGVKLWLRGNEETINLYGYLQEAHLYQQHPTPRQIATRHDVGSFVLWSGTPDVGVENPEFWRRQTGLEPYKWNYDGVVINGYSDANHPWSDVANGQTRSRSLTYPTAGGWLPTLAWEAVRAALYDVRYFTLLNNLAATCMASDDQLVMIEGRRASLWLHLNTQTTHNLDTMRLETVAWCLKLHEVITNTGK